MSNSYTLVHRSLHWLIAGLIVCQYVLAEIGERAREGNDLLYQLAVLANHKSIGMTILALAILRLVYRSLVPAPALPSSMPAWQQTASKLGHFSLYACLFALPVSGWLMSSAKSYSVSWFNLFSFPDLLSADKALAQSLETVHELLGELLIVLVVIHIAAALKHHFIDRDEVLKRMASKGGWLLLASSVIIAVAFGATRPKPNSADTQPETTIYQESLSDVQEEGVLTQARSNLPLWDIDYQQSYIEFTAEQAGAPFTGRWQAWQADIQFSADDLTESRFDVVIDTSSGFTDDQERDDTIRSEEFFDVGQFQEARFQANKFVTSDTGFSTQGQLQMKSTTQPITFRFQVDANGVLTGTASLNRLLWNIGTGDWSNTDWVGKDVDIKVRVVRR